MSGSNRKAWQEAVDIFDTNLGQVARIQAYPQVHFPILPSTPFRRYPRSPDDIFPLRAREVRKPPVLLELVERSFCGDPGYFPKVTHALSELKRPDKNLFYELFMKVLFEIYAPSYRISRAVVEPSMRGAYPNACEYSDEQAVPGGHRVQFPIFVALREKRNRWTAYWVRLHPSNDGTVPGERENKQTADRAA